MAEFKNLYSAKTIVIKLFFLNKPYHFIVANKVTIFDKLVTNNYMNMSQIFDKFVNDLHEFYIKFHAFTEIGCVLLPRLSYDILVPKVP